MQSDKDLSERPQGQLYASLHPGGIPLADRTWVEEGSSVQLNAAVYGLVNAPTAWRKTIVRGIESLGYRRSCYDTCICCLMGESGSQGHILIEVDDLATHGNAVHVENMARLQKTFKFGKWKSIYNSEGDYASRTFIQDQSYRIPKPLKVKRGNCVQCGARSIGSSGRPVLMCQHWHHSAWGHSVTVQCKTCVTRTWQLSD